MTRESEAAIRSDKNARFAQNCVEGRTQTVTPPLTMAEVYLSDDGALRWALA